MRFVVVQYFDKLSCDFGEVQGRIVFGRIASEDFGLLSIQRQTNFSELVYQFPSHILKFIQRLRIEHDVVGISYIGQSRESVANIYAFVME